MLKCAFFSSFCLTVKTWRYLLVNTHAYRWIGKTDARPIHRNVSHRTALIYPNYRIHKLTFFVRVLLYLASFNELRQWIPTNHRHTHNQRASFSIIYSFERSDIQEKNYLYILINKKTQRIQNTHNISITTCFPVNRLYIRIITINHCTK